MHGNCKIFCTMTEFLLANYTIKHARVLYDYCYQTDKRIIKRTTLRLLLKHTEIFSSSYTHHTAYTSFNSFNNLQRIVSSCRR